MRGRMSAAKSYAKPVEIGEPMEGETVAKIAENEALGERHIRLLAPLAFLSPRIIAAIVNGTAPADLTVTGLAKALAVFVGQAGGEHWIVTYRSLSAIEPVSATAKRKLENGAQRPAPETRPSRTRMP